MGNLVVAQIPEDGSPEDRHNHLEKEEDAAVIPTVEEGGAYLVSEPFAAVAEAAEQHYIPQHRDGHRIRAGDLAAELHTQEAFHPFPCLAYH